MCGLVVCFFKQKTAYEMRISDWSSDVCSSDLCVRGHDETAGVAGEHRLFDRHDRLDPILAKIAENADESGAQLTPRRAKFIPIDQDLVQCSEIGRASCRERVCQYV